ncbi:unnamed protein product [Thlaspi arvense]|uniref:Uncharacterized protein n=1 Tax=Thlaspi arvense TaxID=13288 RepID=A0AAU9RU17_THLAR|nr:unnamed protein product [Thlaspi arvense]
MQVHTEGADLAPHPIMPLKGCDIRHLGKGSGDLHGARIRTRFKRSAGVAISRASLTRSFGSQTSQRCSLFRMGSGRTEKHCTELRRVDDLRRGREATLANREEPSRAEDREVGLELSLGSTLYRGQRYHVVGDLIDVSDVGVHVKGMRIRILASCSSCNEAD